jgi:hypothetical protein
VPRFLPIQRCSAGDQTSNTIAHFALDFEPKESGVVVVDTEPDRSLLLRRQRREASAGSAWWRRAIAPARSRGVLHVQAQTCAGP